MSEGQPRASRDEAVTIASHPSISITHPSTPESAYFAVWALQFGTLPELAQKIVREFLHNLDLIISFDLSDGEESTKRVLTRTLYTLIDCFLKQPDLSVCHEPTHTFFKPLTWWQLRNDPQNPGEVVRYYVYFPGFVAQAPGLQLPDYYQQLVEHCQQREDLDENERDTMLASVQSARVFTDESGAAYTYYPTLNELEEINQWKFREYTTEEASAFNEIFWAMDEFAQDHKEEGCPDAPFEDAWTRVRLCLSGGKKCVVRNVLEYPNGDTRGAKLFASSYAPELECGEDPRSHVERTMPDGKPGTEFVLLRSANSDGPPWERQSEIPSQLPFDEGPMRHDSFSVSDLIVSVLRIKSHKTDNWYEMFSSVKVEDTEEAIYFDINFDYGS